MPLYLLCGPNKICSISNKGMYKLILKFKKENSIGVFMFAQSNCWVPYLYRAAGSLKLPLARPRLFRGEIALEDTQIAVLPTTRVSLGRSTHPATRQTIGALNSIDFKFVNPLKISVFLCQAYYVTTPVEPKPRPLQILRSRRRCRV
jgi:hypothetical protein